MAAGLGMFELGTLAPPFLIGGNCIYLIEKINFTYVTNSGLLIGRECVVRVPSLATYHQLELRELLIREDLLLVDTAAVLLALLVEALAVEALIAAINNEKDDIAWYSPRHTKLMGRWSPTLTKLYLKYIKQK